MTCRYVKKPVVIEACRWDGEIDGSTPEWLKSAVEDGTALYDRKDGGMRIMTLEGMHLARVGDYIVKGVRGELYPCKPDVFEETYERVEDD